MTPDDRFRRYQDFQRYVGWTDDDARNVRSVATLLGPHLPAIVDDFYAEIERHPAARRVVTGGAAQIERPKRSLLAWLRELLSGPYDQGLALARAVLDKNRGSLHVTSTPGAGTTFTVRITAALQERMAR